MWVYREGLDVNPDVPYILDALLTGVVSDPQIAMLALPRQRAVGGGESCSQDLFT